MKLSQWIGETTEYDKKLVLEEKRPKSWLKSVSAFANGTGGTLIFGVSDDDELAGLADAKAVSEKISEAIKVRMDPIPQVYLEIGQEDGKEFLLLHVSGGQETPYYYVGDGSRTAFVRVGNESVPADAVALKRLVLRGMNMTYDSMRSPYDRKDYSFTKLCSVYRNRTGAELTESDFLSFELADEMGKLTNAGALLADEPPLRHSRLFCTRWYGLDKASGILDALDDKEYQGSLVSLLENGIEFVKNNTKKPWKKNGSGRVEMPEYPEQAVHESLVNALIHRDYMELGSEVHIDIFDDRMEIYSPGGMFDGSIVQELDTDHIASKRRNPVIADLFSRMHYMERRGSGFKKIKADYRRAVHYQPELEPQFRSTPSSFFVTLYNLNYPIRQENGVLADEKVAFGGGKVAFDDEKVVFDDEEVVFGDEKIALDDETAAFGQSLAGLNANTPTKKKARILFEQYGYERIFGRAELIRLFGGAPSSAGKLLKKLRDAGMLESVSGQGKGKYRFSRRGFPGLTRGGRLEEKSDGIS